MASNSSSMWWAHSSTSRTWSLLWWPAWWAGLHPPKLLLIKQGLWRWSRYRTWSTSWRMRSMLWTGTTLDACSSQSTPGRGGVTWRTWTPSSSTSSRPAQVLLALWKEGAAPTKLQRVKNGRPSTCLLWPPSGESLQHHGVWTSSLRWKQLACSWRGDLMDLCAGPLDQMEPSQWEPWPVPRGAPWWMTTWASRRAMMQRRHRTASKRQRWFGQRGLAWTSQVVFYLAITPQRRTHSLATAGTYWRSLWGNWVLCFWA